jgi:hypothetical protein
VYDQNNTLLPISAADVTVHGAEECKGTLDLLFNGKFKVSGKLFYFMSEKLFHSYYQHLFIETKLKLCLY